MTILYTNPKDLSVKIRAGRLTIYMLVTISTILSFGYWYHLSNLENQQPETLFWTIVLWATVCSGVAIDIARTVVLVFFRHLIIYFILTSFSVLSVLSVYLILDNKLEVTLKKGSDDYKDNRDAKLKAEENAAKYAHMTGVTLAELQAERQANIDRAGSNKARRKSGATYQEYVLKNKEIDQRIEDLKDYNAAINTTKAKKKDMDNSDSGLDNNPLMSKIALITGIAKGFLVMLLYAAISITLEWASWYLGGEIKKIKEFATLTRLQILDKQVQAEMGYSLAHVRKRDYEMLVDMQTDQELLNREMLMIKKARLKKLEDMEKEGFRGDAKETRERIVNIQDRMQANNDEAGELDLEGYTLEELNQRVKDYKQSATSSNRTCPACHGDFEPLHYQQYFCTPEHRNQFNKHKRRASRGKNGALTTEPEKTDVS